MSKFIVNDSQGGETTGPYDTLSEALEDANANLSEYRKCADEGWGLEEGDLCIYEAPDDYDMADGDLEDCKLVSMNVETNRRIVDEDGEPFHGFDYVCDMAMSDK